MEKGEKIRWIILSTLIATFLTVIGNIVSNQLLVRDGKINDAASVELVDRKQAEMKGYVDTQDNAIWQELREATIDLNEDMDRIDKKLDNITDILMRKQ